VQICRLPDVPHADCDWQVPPPAWQHTAGALQSADDAQVLPPLLDPDPPLLLEPLELPPQAPGCVAQYPPLLEPELEPAPLLLLPAPDDEAAPAQTLPWQAPPVVVQSEQRAPALPHALSTLPVWQVPVASQHPAAQLWGVQVPVVAPLPLSLPLDPLAMPPLEPPPLEDDAEPSSPDV
jgi:hypothetical protein